MIVHVDLPDLRAGSRIQRIDVRFGIAEVGREARTPTLDADRAAHSGFGLEHPIHAARGGVERIDGSRINTHEYTSCGDGRLGVYGFGSRESESPLQFELRYVRGPRCPRPFGPESVYWRGQRPSRSILGQRRDRGS